MLAFFDAAFFIFVDVAGFTFSLLTRYFADIVYIFFAAADDAADDAPLMLSFSSLSLLSFFSSYVVDISFIF